MSERKRVLLLIIIMAVSSLLAAGAAISVLYRTAYGEQRARLAEMAQSQARLIEAVARFDAIYSNHYPEGPLAATLSQLTDAHKHYRGLGKTGEFTLARREGNDIVFLWSHRHADPGHPKAIPFDSELAVPMRWALSGRSGTVVGLDYRGELVLAAHEPVTKLNLGIVAKIDLAEVRAPFIRAGMITLGFAVLVVFAGAGLFLRVSTPILKRLEKETAASASVIVRLKQEAADRKRTEQALRESERKYRNLFEHANDSIFIIEPSTHRFLEVNENAARRLGYTREELLQFTIDRIDTPMAAQRNEAIIQELWERGSVTFEHAHLHKNGTEMPVEISSRIVEYGGHQVFLSIVRDTSERKRIEGALQRKTHELKERVKELNCLYEISHLRERPGINLAEILQGVVELLPSALQYPDVACSRIILEGREYATKHFKETDWKLASDIIAYGKPLGRLEVGYLEEKPAADEGPFLIEEKHLITAVAERVGRITEAERSEEALLNERDNLINILNSMEVGVYIANRDYEIEYLNPALEKEFGRLKGRKCYEYFADREEICPWCRNQEVFSGKTVRWEWYSAKNQKTYDIIDTPLKNRDGSISKLELFHDITERKRAEKALQKAHDELEMRVERRTAALRRLSSRLLSAQEEERKRIALELHDSIGQSLSAVKFRVEAALKGLDEEKGVNVVESLEPVISVVQEAVEEVRRISMNLRPSILDDLGILATISWFCREVGRTYSGIRIEKQMHIGEKDVPDSLKIVIYRLVQEAINNVAKHSQASLVSLSLRKRDNRIELTIHDNGMGFDVEHMPHGDQPRRGVGLASMKERTELSGGSFSIGSGKGAGTTVRASWPLMARRSASPSY